MTRTFLLPDLGEGLTEAEIVHWLVHEGDEVVVDQPIVEVETAKAVVEVPVPYAGTIETLHAAEGDTLDVGAPLITIGGGAGGTSHPAAETERTVHPDGERYREEERAGSGNVLVGYGTSATATATRRRRPRTARAAAPVTAPTTDTAAPEAPTRRVPRVISPLVRRLARDAGLSLHTIEPSGVGGIIRKIDVERAMQATPAESAAAVRTVVESVPGELRIPLSGFRRAVAETLGRSRREIPEVTVWVDVDATALLELRENHRTPTDPGPGLLAYLARFVVAGLTAYPVLNARFDSDANEIVQLDRIDLGLAVQTDRGLLVPAVIGADHLTTRQLDAEIRRLTTSTRAGRATTRELTSGTFTLNNYGVFGVDGSAAIINHPQVAILGVGRIIDRPWAVDGALAVRKVTQLSFVFDHRVCDGGTAAGFLRIVADAMEDPASILPEI